jgi:transposase
MNFTFDSRIMGIDVHKFSHTAVCLDCFGQRQASFTFSNQSIDRFLTWLTQQGKQTNIIIGIEDICGYGIHVARELMGQGYTLRYVPPVLTSQEGKASAHRQKNDVVDAERVGKVILHKMEKTLPATHIIPDNYQTIRNLDLLVQERSSLVRQQTELKNQLHSLLHQYYGDGYYQGFKNCFREQAKRWYLQDLQTDSRSQPGLAASLRRHFNRLDLVQSQIKTIQQEMTNLSKYHPGTTALMEQLPGCGLESACRIVAQIGNIKRFKTQAKLARYSGTAPREHSSGSRIRHYTDYGGNRRLNQAFHTIALTQINKYGPDYAKIYYGKKQGEGKTNLWSLRCLKRRVSDKVFTILTQTR